MRHEAPNGAAHQSRTLPVLPAASKPPPLTLPCFGIRVYGQTLDHRGYRSMDLWGCDFRNTTLRAVDFRGSRLDGAEFEGARYDAECRLPEGFDPRAHGAQPLQEP